MRSNMFEPGRIFAMYVARLAKADIQHTHPTYWARPYIKAVAIGLTNAQDLLCKFGNFLFAGDLLRLLKPF